MYLENISLLHFKNYQELKLNFSRQINCFVGGNGSGKTNLLDAIHYLSLTKSAFNTVDSQNIQHNAPYLMVMGDFRKGEQKDQVHCSFQKSQKKVFKLNRQPYEKISDHIGQFPVVLIAPNDTDIIREGSEFRRRFFDAIISQIDPDYLENLMKYNRLLKQRNSLLKQFSDQHYIDYELISTYDVQLLNVGKRIFEGRNLFIQEFNPIFLQHYQNLCETQEEVTLTYSSALQEENFEVDFRNALEKDLVLQRTTKGTHKDDFKFEIEGYPLKKFGSQGQQKSYLIALKLAHFDIVKDHKGFKPILLLDDIFDKLDDRRIERLMQMVASHTFGQLFLTDARPERTERIFKSIAGKIKIFHIKKGQVLLEK
ncbi:DNA replication/repair protein RecF, partial [Xanthovirga aplysinae]|uniref:DNA replication/repair protein RecF n=1 Tax=Xanthovirga aplysinae TaxID=2529853 RepID=UPI0012BC3FDE